MKRISKPKTFNITQPPKVLAEEEKALFAARKSLIAFGKLCLPGDFLKTSTPQFHYEASRAYLDPDIHQLGMFLPRGHAKTTMTKCFLLQKLCNRMRDEEPHFIGWVADTQRKARRNLLAVKKHILHNPRIKRYYNLHPDSRKWTADEILLMSGDGLVSKSNASSLRGESEESIEHGALRYSIICLDDIENEENTKSEYLREEIRNTVFNGIKPAFNLSRKDWKLIYNATPVHWDSLCYRIISKWKESQDRGEPYTWHVIYKPATQPDLPGGVLWQSRFPKEKLDKIKLEYIEQGKVTGYDQEYELVPQGKETRIWSSDHYKYHNVTYIWDEKEQQGYIDDHGIKMAVNCFLGSDPATDINTARSDHSCVLIVAVTNDLKIYVLDYIMKKGLREIGIRDEFGNLIGEKGVVDHIFDLYETFHCKNGTVEDVGMTRGIWQQYEAERIRRKSWKVVLEPAKPGGVEKLNKIKTGLDVHFAYRRIHIRKDQIDLAHQIENMGPLLGHDDVIESLYFATLNMYPPSDNIVKTAKRIANSVQNWKVL